MITWVDLFKLAEKEIDTTYYKDQIRELRKEGYSPYAAGKLLDLI